MTTTFELCGFRFDVTYSVLSKYFRVLSDIGLTEFQILSDRTKFCRTKLFIKPIVKLCSVLFSIT